jgi:hypothetical protein
MVFPAPLPFKNFSFSQQRQVKAARFAALAASFDGVEFGLTGGHLIDKRCA